ncbi:DUF6691 family protein [Woeseia oceani]|uniref:Uncharacterized protein n=1 Tax=Woeseia oceani TaxID=1548547 RepID=A0A193LIF3_9GAMM|nr:DUF6691 family protein [Woeseia oceani]ANO52282.1 hypothetical protein BA177_14775 [Woeseia oceani]
MKTKLAALLAGALFGLGLAISQMINPEKVIAFLDVTGNWDPSLALVLAAAVIVSFIGFRLAKIRVSPLLAPVFRAPTRTDLDRRLLSGAAIFGMGWGLAGYCPGPAIAALAIGSWEPVVFLLAMTAGSLVMSRIDSRNT